MKRIITGALVLLLLVQCKPQYDHEDASHSSSYQYMDLELSRMRIPMGGVGTGDILVGGRGDIAFMEILNRPNRIRQPYKTFFSLWVRQGDKAPVAKLLERELLPPYDHSTHQYVYGLPRFRGVTLINTYPLPVWNFSDEDIPLDIELEVFSPFIPTDLEKSSFPLVTFKWRIRNPGKVPVQASIALNIENPIEADCLLNEFYQENRVRGLRFTTLGEVEANHDGTMIVGTTAPDVQVQTHWYPGRWRDDAHVLWSDFSDDGQIEPALEPSFGRYKPVSYNETSGRNGTVLVQLDLEPGASMEIPFYLAWYFPDRVFTLPETFGMEAAAGKVFRNYYSTLFNSADDVLNDFLSRQKELYNATRQFTEALHASTYPSYVIEALATQAATLKTHLIQVTGDGDVHGFEGVGPNGWCCPGTCTHVWNYEQTLASLFPEQERKMRSIEFNHDTFENGFQTHRSVFPLGDYWFNGPAAADGQMGSIVRVYREWKLSGDTEWLRSIWPKVKKALEFAWYGPGEIKEERLQFQAGQTPWDPDKDGIMTGRQHNTYDISFFGPNSMTSSLYLAALKACAEMATAMGEPEKSKDYYAVYNRGVASMESDLWNGDYFIQIIAEDPTADEGQDYELSPQDPGGQRIPKYQYGDGCLADQLLGQYLAHISGLGFIFDQDKVNTAIYSVYENNFIRQLRDFANVQRVYGLNDESGVVLCTWPQGNRPLLPFVYADELWTGVEYQVAASLIYSGFTDEGLEVVKAIQDRYNGYKRNPYEHDESGVHYARAMAAWSVLLALSGFDYDGVEKSLAFSPILDERVFSTFWSCNGGWGAFHMDGKEARLEVLYGNLSLEKFALGNGIQIASGSEEGTITSNERLSVVLFEKAVYLSAGDQLTFELK